MNMAIKERRKTIKKKKRKEKKSTINNILSYMEKKNSNL